MPAQRHGHLTALTSLLAITFLVSVSMKLVGLPVNRAIEDRYCVAYYVTHDTSLIGADGQVPEQHCKIPAIQQDVGLMVGALETVTIGCDLLSTAPLAYLADVLGRSRVLLLNLSAMLLRLAIIVVVASSAVLPISLVLLAPVLSVFGGSISLNTSLLLAYASDIAQTETQRSTYISWLYCLPFIAGMIGPSIAAMTMARSLSIPLLLAALLSLLTLPMVSLLPSQDPVPELKRRLSDDVVESSRLLEESSGQDRKHTGSRAPRLSRSTWYSTVADLGKSYIALVADKPNFRALLLGFFLTGLASASSALLPLLLSTRFGWTFVQIGVIFSFKAIVNLVMSVAVVPAFSSFMRSDGQAKASYPDQLGSFITLSISAFGAALIAVAASKPMAIFSLCIYAVGSVAGTFMYALSRSPDLAVLNRSNDSRGYALIVLVHSLGGFVGTPAMALMWSSAQRAGGLLLGLPFALSCLAYMCCIMTIRALR